MLFELALGRENQLAGRAASGEVLVSLTSLGQLVGIANANIQSA